MSKQFVLNLCKYALAFGLLGWVIWANWAPANGRGLEYVWQRHLVEGAPVHVGYFVMAIVLFSTSLVLTILRWYFLVRAVDLPLAPLDAVRFGLVGFFYNTFLPGSVGGDIIKAAALAREQSRRTAAVATVLMDRVIALWGLVWFVAILGGAFWWMGMLQGEKALTVVQGAGLIVAVSGAVWLLMGLLPEKRAEGLAGWLAGIPKVGHSAGELWRTVWMYRCRQKSVAVAILLSWIGFLGFVGCFYCCARTLGDGSVPGTVPDLLQHFLIVPVGMVIMAVPLFPGGAGIGELGFGLLYGWFGYDPALGVLGSLLQRVVMWLLGLVGYIVFLRMKQAAPAAEQAPEEAPSAERELVLRAG